MIYVFQTLLILMMLISFIGAISSKEKDIQQMMAMSSAVTVVALTITFVY
ncbi:hypothetical protein [Alkalicoccus chagannorensis]|nr:hypothetical protein [Alkalicoccus chagannorensis]